MPTLCEAGGAVVCQRSQDGWQCSVQRRARFLHRGVRKGIGLWARVPANVPRRAVRFSGATLHSTVRQESTLRPRMPTEVSPYDVNLRQVHSHCRVELRLRYPITKASLRVVSPTPCRTSAQVQRAIHGGLHQ